MDALILLLCVAASLSVLLPLLQHLGWLLAGNGSWSCEGVVEKKDGSFESG